MTATQSPADSGASQLPQENTVAVQFGSSIQYQAPTTTINPAIAADFDLKTIQNIQEMEKAYGVTFSDADLKALSDNKFVVKNLLDTNIRPNSSGDNIREFSQLYDQVKGSNDPHTRGPQNAVFLSSDAFLNAYNNLYTELLKEMENKQFYPAMRDLTKAFYQKASDKLTATQSDADKQKWTKVRNYFAVPYAIFTTAAQPLSNDSYYQNGQPLDPSKVMADFAAKDAKVDTYENVASFVKNLHLDSQSESDVLVDLKSVYDAKDNGIPKTFTKEYSDYAAAQGIGFKVDWTQFTPRGTYVSSSLRRQYFRGMKWFIMLPFFVKSPDLTNDAFAITQLLAENPQQLSDYNKLESAIDFMVGTSDDLMPVDYLQALQAAKGAADPTQATMDYLIKARNPMIKDMPADYLCVGCVSSEDTLLKAKSMRFFSGKFIIDSYWTGQLTQGDEAVKPGYPQKLPPMASSLEVMTILGSDYAKSQIPKLDFYTPKYSQAVDKAVTDLTAQTNQLTQSDWTKNLYTGWMWTIKSLFGFVQTNHDSLPRFMQSSAWAAKTLQTATAWWTELRHATILYAKQSFAEMGGGGGDCDTRQIPQAPKGYIEPQADAYARLSYLAKRTDQGLKDLGMGDLQNLPPLENFISLMDKVQSYTAKELGNAALTENITQHNEPISDDPSKTCTFYTVDSDSDWENLRLGIIQSLHDSLPVPTEGPVLAAKDRRAALVADVHTGGDSDNPLKILYEGEGVPYVIFTAVSDANGPRLTVGFVYSQYEFTKPYGGQRLTDEDWQKNFYVGTDPFNAYQYTSKATQPQVNPWYAPIFGGQ
jgi:hypothetical protein